MIEINAFRDTLNNSYLLAFLHKSGTMSLLSNYVIPSDFQFMLSTLTMILCSFNLQVWRRKKEPLQMTSVSQVCTYSLKAMWFKLTSLLALVTT